jgi:hypothetical protein
MSTCQSNTPYLVFFLTQYLNLKVWRSALRYHFTRTASSRCSDVVVSYISGKIVSEFLRLVLVQHVHVGNINKVVF